MNTPELITDRLILRRFSEDDIPYLYRILRDETVNRFLPWFPLKSLEETEEFYNKRYKAVYEMEEGYQWAIALKDDNIPIGYINVDTTDSHDLGYGLIKEYWNKGIVTEAGRSVIQCVKENENAIHHRNT